MIHSDNNKIKEYNNLIQARSYKLFSIQKQTGTK